MSGFSADWLTLREPYDGEARNAEVLDAVAAFVAGFPAIGVVDLACGTGSTLRAIGDRLPLRQSWRLVDNDLGLLARAGALARPPDLIVTPVPVDLARDLELALDGPVDLVTTSALIDLVSPEWLDRLVVETAARRLPVYAALSYDGRAPLEPFDPLDARLISAATRASARRSGRPRRLRPSPALRLPATRSCEARPTGSSRRTTATSSERS